MVVEINEEILEAVNQETPVEDIEISVSVIYEKKIDNLGRAYATGKRKNAVARVWIKPGNGQVSINGKKFEVFFARQVLRMIFKQPLNATDNKINLISHVQFQVVVYLVRQAP